MSASFWNKVHILKLPFKGEQGNKLIKSISNTVNWIQPNNHESRFISTGTKLVSEFKLKDKTEKTTLP